MDSCTQLRRMVVTHGTLNIVTGAHTPGRKEWVIKPCGVPLTTDEQRKRGTCRSCASGWTHPQNYPVRTIPFIAAAGVLAGAFGFGKGRSPLPERMLRHAVQIDESDHMVRVFCKGARLDHLADDTEDLLDLNCPRCIRALQRQGKRK